MGEIVGLVAVITDITERKLAEQEVAAARDKALEASRAKDEFLARLSHELRTPLNPVLLLASEAAANPALPDDIRADFETIAQNVTLEARLIDDLLDLTAITRGKVSLDLRPVQIHSVLQDALAMMRRDIGAKKLRVTLQLRAEHQVVLGDDMRLKQVFWNVIKNAVKFTPDGGEMILRTEADGAKKRLTVHIADSGLGLTSGELERIFAAFAQGDHASNGGGKFGGLGLGLVISRMLVQLHSGVIHANSGGRDQGSTFSIELPLCELPLETKVANGPESNGVNRLNAKKPAKRRVLLVEDHEPTCVTLTELLSRRGYIVVAATTLRHARELAGGGEFDILISDIGLPDGSGCDLMAELRDRRPLVGIALTGYGMLEDMERSREAGFVTHLTKPVSIAALDKALALLVPAQV
jgi:CheY-like chemotaxis protein/nitrogen-specific signal transduction histidine kinase